MRAGIVRTDLGPGVYTADVESRVQRDFSREPPGQSRNLRRPTNAEITAALNQFAALAIRGTDMAVTVSTLVNNTLRIRATATAPFTVIVVAIGAAVAKTTIRNNLNAAFTTNGLPFVALITGVNQIQINTLTPDMGPSAYLEVDSVANGSTLNTAVGFPVGGSALTGLSVAALKAAVYPTPTTIDVSSATIGALSTFSLLSAVQLDLLVDAIGEVIAPFFVETGQVLLSFAFGVFSKMRSAAFQPGGPRAGLPAGLAAAFVQDDGSSPFVL